MDPMKKVISSFMLDVNNYLSFVSDYGKPNHNYFNYVLNRMGIMHLFTNKTAIFPLSSNATRFVDGVYIALKNRFLSEDSTDIHQSSLKRAAIIFFFCKIFFTDDIGNILKLRIVNDEWLVFLSYLKSIKNQPAYLPIRIMFYHLFTENFFKFTMKNKALALDYGEVDKDPGIKIDPNEDVLFWSDITKEIKTLDRNDIAALLELEALRNEAMEPFDSMFPERSSINEALEEFETLKEIVFPQNDEVPAKATRKQVSQQIKNYFKSSGPSGSMDDQFDSEDIDMHSGTETETEKKKTRKNRRKKAGNSKKIEERRDSNSSESEDGNNFKRMVRSLGFNSQNVMKGIGVETFSEKVKRCYEKIE